MSGEITIGEAIRIARHRLGMSARELSAKAGFSPSYVNKLEANEIEPSLRAFACIAKAVEMTQAEIYFCVLYEAAKGHE